MATRLVILGGGGCGREVLDVIDALNHLADRYVVEGVLDDGHPDSVLLGAFGVGHLGAIARLADLDEEVGYIVGTGNPAPRERLAAAAADRGSPVLVHPSVAMSQRKVSLAPGVVICSHVSVQNHVQIGRHVHVNQNCTIGHDVTVGDFSVLSPLVAVSGNVHIGRGVLVGAGASILPGVSLGDGSVVGAGAAVVRDVLAGVTVVGVPARTIGQR